MQEGRHICQPSLLKAPYTRWLPVQSGSPMPNGTPARRHAVLSYNNNGEKNSPRDARSVKLANFHWKLVHRYELSSKVP